VANLLLSRATGRERELRCGSRSARPAPPRRQLLTESLLLATIGAVVGLRSPFSAAARCCSSSQAPRRPCRSTRGSTRPFAFTAGVTLGQASSLARAALRATRPDLNVVLRGTPTTSPAAAGRPVAAPRILVGAQVALSLILLVTAGLFVRSLQNLSAVPLGTTRRRS
jgi:hypothetical protein